MPPYKQVQQLIYTTSEKPKKSLFRIVWQLHSGELFGIAGRLIADGIAIILAFLCITGICIWLIPRVRFHHVWHDKIGRFTIGLTIFISLTGWCLRPPMLLLVAGKKWALLLAPTDGAYLHLPRHSRQFSLHLSSRFTCAVDTHHGLVNQNQKT
ncbi:PepSY domain-containing protein [Segatella baroniae]|uniref:PepSY domain-containing protein n=1 Tax=Segatella baroniae TaxID=305719 RepID=UPI0004135272